MRSVCLLLIFSTASLAQPIGRGGPGPLGWAVLPGQLGYVAQAKDHGGIHIDSTDTIEVERQVIVRDKLPLAKTLPIKLTAPEGGFLYQWKFPDGWTATGNASTATVTAALNGVATVSVRWIEIDFEGKKVTEKSATLTIVVGGLKPPEPTDPWAVEFKRLYEADSDPKKADHIAALTTVFTAAAKLVTARDENNQPKVITPMQLADAVRQVSRELVPATALPKLRARIGELITESLDAFDPDAVMDAAARDKAAALYNRIAKALEAVK